MKTSGLKTSDKVFPEPASDCHVEQLRSQACIANVWRALLKSFLFGGSQQSIKLLSRHRTSVALPVTRHQLYGRITRRLTAKLPVFCSSYLFVAAWQRRLVIATEKQKSKCFFIQKSITCKLARLFSYFENCTRFSETSIETSITLYHKRHWDIS